MSNPSDPKNQDPKNQDQKSQDLLNLIERLGNLLRVESRCLGRDSGLQPVHWQVLDYLARANRMSDTPVALSQYLGISKGTTSQSLLVLQNKGLISKRPDAHDRRSLHLELTPQGRQRLAQQEDQTSRRLLAETLSTEEQAICITSLQGLLRGLIQAQQGKTFGVCRSCRFFMRDDAGSRCALINETLTEADSQKICHEHQFS